MRTDEIGIVESAFSIQHLGRARIATPSIWDAHRDVQLDRRRWRADGTQRISAQADETS